jgi:hypothetical protein
MKTAILFVCLSVSCFAQQAKTPPNPDTPKPPQVGVSTSIALRSIVQAKKDSQMAFSQALQNETAILGEWKQSHPGYHLDAARGYEVTPDSPTTEAKDLSRDKPQK